MKKSIMSLFCILISSCMLFGCGKTEGEKGMQSQEREGQSQENEGQNQEESVPGGAQNQESDGGQKENISADGKEQQEASSGNNIINTGKTEDTNPAFELLENYREMNIPSVYTEENEKEYYCNVILNEEKEIEYYTVEEQEDGYDIWKYTLKEDGTKEEEGEKAAVWTSGNGLLWMREKVSWLEGVKGEISYGRIAAFRGEDGNDYAWYMGSEEKAHLVKRDNDSCIEIPVSDWRITEQAAVAVLANGNVVSADAGRECFVYNQEDGSLLTRFQCGWYESICVRGNIIYISTQGGASVQRYDAEKQEFLPTVEAGFDKSVRIALQEDDIYVCTPDGIFRAKESDARFQKVMEAQNFHFAKESGVLLKFFVIGDAFYVVYGEDKGSIKSYFPAEKKEVSNVLTVYSLESNDIILDMISEFQNQYPDIELIYQTGEGADGSITMADRIRALNARILAGDGPDVMLLDGLPVESYIKKGILEDLNPILGSLKEELLSNILAAYTAEEKIYMLPLRIKIPMFMTSGQEPKMYSTLETLVEYSETEGGIGNLQYSYLDFLQILYYNYTPDFQLNNGTINRDAVAEFLSLVKRFCDSEQVTGKQVWGTSYLQGRNMERYFVKGEADFAFLTINGGYELGISPAAAKERNGALVYNNEIFFPNGLLGINALSAKKELSALFTEFAFSYEIQNRYVALSGYPIHARILDEYAQMDLSYITQGDNVTDLRWFTAEESSWAAECVKKASVPVMVEESVWEILSSVAEDYLNGTKGLDESVDELVSRLQLYWYEQ